MRRKRRLPPDTRLKWDDPRLDTEPIIFTAFTSYTADEIRSYSRLMMGGYDSMSKKDRDEQK